jgi:Calcineurin-like phosphoesterase
MNVVKQIMATSAVGAAALAGSVVAADPAESLGEPVIAAVGDMACDPSDRAWKNGDGGALACAQKRTSERVMTDPLVGGVLGLGDYQYDCDDPADFAVSYTPTWGRLGDRITPVAGNHEYKVGTDVYGATCPSTNATAQTFFSYFANSHPETNGHFSFDLGTWHLIGLNGNCKRAGGCTASSAQTGWLTADLAATTQPCILAYWHQPLFQGLTKPTNLAYKAWWEALYAAHADVVLNGHIHNYQRYPALNPAGAPDPVNGITEYVIGTGGERQVALNTTVTPQPDAYAKSFGYLRMTLGTADWTAEFIDDLGYTRDNSTGVCHA